MSEFPNFADGLDPSVLGSKLTGQAELSEHCYYTTEPVITSYEISQVLMMMTPLGIRDRIEHGHPRIISPTDYPTFSHLVGSKKQIRDLKLVPKRTEEVQKEYEKMGHESFLRIIQGFYLSYDPIVLVTELYPSDLPFDTEQRVIWVRQNEVSDGGIARFIAQVMRVSGLGVDDVILFERSKTSNTPFVRVAVSELRHIHFLSRKKSF